MKRNSYQWCLFLNIFFLFFSPSHAQSKNCIYRYNPTPSTLKWTAFKTPKKVGVTVSFDRFIIISSPASSVYDVIKNASFKVDVSSLNSGNPQRDEKIKNFFFKQNQKKRKVEIKGKVLSLEGNVAKVEFEINNVKKTIPMNISLTNEIAVLTSSIDVLDFNLSQNLEAINKACKALHEGKTWSDVQLELTAHFSAVCK